MCYYARTDYVCGDWRWGNLKLRCPREHRIGEACGLKLVHHESVVSMDETCRICQEIAVKNRRLQREKDNIERWTREGGKLAASIDKAHVEVNILENKIERLNGRRPAITTRQNWEIRGGPIGSRASGGEVLSGNSHIRTPNGNPNPGGYVSGQSRGYYSSSLSPTDTDGSWPRRSG